MTKEPATVSINIRISKPDKALLVQAARISQMTVASFVQDASVLAAQKVSALRARAHAQAREKRDWDNGWRKTREQRS